MVAVHELVKLGPVVSELRPVELGLLKLGLVVSVCSSTLDGELRRESLLRFLIIINLILNIGRMHALLIKSGAGTYTIFWRRSTVHRIHLGVSRYD